MSAVTLDIEDLALLKELARDLNFEDDERQSAILENDSRDFNAVPGSGKTSLLAAKLMLLARKWPHARRGICVLSHTNVARDEIARRLAATVQGSKLLNYPHFIGTIHSFANHFLAIPMLRSMGIVVEVIDDDVFAKKARAFIMQSRFRAARNFLENQHGGLDIATTLFFKDASLSIESENGKLPSPNSLTFRSLLTIKEALKKQGIFRHRDMFAFTEMALKRCPHVERVLSHRFPMVFIDEMQDTSWEQESFLNQLFDGKSVMQRFGDVDQKILSDESNEQLLTFPRNNFGTISTSKRFGPAIAKAVESVCTSGGTVIGDGVDRYPPMLLLYSSERVSEVIEHFGSAALSRLGGEAAALGTIKAMCARKTGEGKVEVGRHIRDYWPEFSDAMSEESVRSENFWNLVSGNHSSQKTETLCLRVTNFRRALFLLLREAGAEMVEGMRGDHSLCRIARDYSPSNKLDLIVRYLALKSSQVCQDDQRASFLIFLHKELSPYLPHQLSIEDFKALQVFKDIGAGLTQATHSVKCKVLENACSLELNLGTVASMKGETHLASLVLESYGGSSKRHDVSLGLEYIAGLPSKPLSSLTKTQKAQMRNLYVAMSRPTTLLCLAANKCRVSTEVIEALTSLGWEVEHLN